MSQTFTKIFSRDFCMMALEASGRSEARDDKPWHHEPNPHRPYILIERSDGTSHIWYNTSGVEWTHTQLLKSMRNNPAFLQELEQRVREGIAPIRGRYEAQTALDTAEELIEFIDVFMRAYPWVEAMWWIKDMDAEEVGEGHAKIVALRTETETLSAGTEIVMRKTLEKLYPELGVASAMIRIDELKSGSIPSPEVLEGRFAEFTLVDGEFVSMSLSEVAIQQNLILESVAVDMHASEISGQAAYKGKIQGTVCRIMGHLDFGKITSGQILVSPMTMVDFLPEMQKAAAFVTDEGGITCHAAIVAREMKKPCIVGTKIATQILKDGDMVEVDAEMGIVRILKRHA